MKLTSHDSGPARVAVIAAKQARVLGASVVVTGQEALHIGEEDEHRIVERRLADLLAHEMIKETAVYRSIDKGPTDFDPFGIKYEAKIVVIPRTDWRNLMDALSFIARREKVGTDYGL